MTVKKAIKILILLRIRDLEFALLNLRDMNFLQNFQKPSKS